MSGGLHRRRLGLLAGALVAVLLVAACSGSAEPAASVELTPGSTAPATVPASPPTSALPSPTSISTSTSQAAKVSTTEPAVTTTTLDPRYRRPDWLGTPLVELIAGTNYGVAQPTPPELVDRRLATVDLLAPPDTDAYVATISAVPDEVVARSTWTPQCPVGLDGLRYLTMTFWGFDERPHTGEMIVNASIAEMVTEVFAQLYDLRYPIEDMSVMPAEFWERTPSGDDNITSSFECRAAVGGSGGWSNHAFGLAIDINPFHNPYRKGDLVLPELAEAYFDRDDVRPGMIVEGDAVVAIFDELGWGWGGRWSSALDYMHFSHNGR